MSFVIARRAPALLTERRIERWGPSRRRNLASGRVGGSAASSPLPRARSSALSELADRSTDGWDPPSSARRLSSAAR
ncbi:hypothetical protein EMIHUDRAFT_254176 [Emiliania huxleyi CCMP1516]|uniref:Uncharacterized protein n=2 Tax=Emiliania huxleyi TaxID=2903 RepID=A0A0D3JWY2_EMIH1|nr:hypothetical protein EMIHUDRAFT_254176 [Emiliania huxleyi CCMP1516]EOD28017.1 hypothetical protein EMIHUDRAFT_254176 [Emiliania huxleyi CCMP1516]|eukprot:XP_005780446.1 hypothetical protein EMIHUDRAFT_254176 [Emiliania huxleyi CCMP1516]